MYIYIYIYLAEFKHPVIKKYGGSEGISPYALNCNLGTRRTLNVWYRLWPLFSRENGLWYKLENRMCDVNFVHGYDEEETVPYKNREVESSKAICSCGWSILDHRSFMKHLHCAHLCPHTSAFLLASCVKCVYRRKVFGEAVDLFQIRNWKAASTKSEGWSKVVGEDMAQNGPKRHRSKKKRKEYCVLFYIRTLQIPETS